MKDEGSRQEGRMFRRAIWPWILVLVCFLAVSALHGSKGNACGSLETSILRFHVLANSDSEEDQNVKKKVRNTLAEYLETLLAPETASKEKSDLQHTEQLVEAHLSDLEEKAEQVLN